MKWTPTAAVVLALSAQTLSKRLPSDVTPADLVLRDIGLSTRPLSNLQRRAVCTEAELDQQVEDSEDDTGPAPATAGDAGFGAEFETAYVQIKADEGCSFEDKKQSQGQDHQWPQGNELAVDC